MGERKKHIRPLIAFKKEAPEIYKFLISQCEAHSSKGKENEFYFFYFQYFSGIKFLIREVHVEIPFLNPFYYLNGSKNNIGTVSELGRLLLTGWTYNILDFTKEIGNYIYQAYQRKNNKGEEFNDLEFKEAVKIIRENVVYYFHNKEELKLYILQTFFKEDLKPLLPEKPEKLKILEEVIDELTNEHKKRLKKDKNWYIKAYNALEDYTGYLQETLDHHSIQYLRLEEFTKESETTSSEYLKEYAEAQKDYNEIIKTKALEGVDKFLKNR